MKGFFSIEKPKQETRTNKFLSCLHCGLDKFAHSPKMSPFGGFKKQILNIGEAPGEEEDRKGRQWQGRMGRLLQKTYNDLGINLFEDCLNINAVNCRPIDKRGSNRTPTTKEIACCRSKVLQVIQEHKPKIIIVLGGQALTSVLGHRWMKDLGGITKWRGWTIPDKELQAWVCPTFHPSYIGRNEGAKEIERIWKNDLYKIFQLREDILFDLPTQKSNDNECVEILDEIPKIYPNGLDKIEVAIDYETTGLKPHREGHKIVCASIATSPGKSYAFPVEGQGEKQIRRLKRLLRAVDIDKIGHNIKFETTWSRVSLGVDVVNNWVWDTMLASHVLDNRTGITGLKFQAYVNFGVTGYDNKINNYLEGTDKKNANSHNRIMELWNTKEGRNDLLLYCGLDALYTYRLAELQRSKLNVRPTTDGK